MIHGNLSASLQQRALLLGLVMGSLFGLSACKDEVVDFSVFHTNDLHYQLHPVKSDEFGLGGLSRLSGLLKKKRGALNHPSVTLDAGDWSEGAWYYNLDAGEGMLRIFKEMGTDAVVVGNHDYLSRPDTLWSTIRNAEIEGKVATLGANFDLGAYDRAEEFRKYIQSSVILERGGLKVGVIGLSTFDYVFSFWLDPVKTIEPIEAAQIEANRLRPQVDVLLIVSHNAFSLNEQIARSVSGIDAVISGHSHFKAVKPSLVQNAGRKIPVVETGNWGRFLGELKLEVNRTQKIVQFKDYSLTPVDSDAPSDPNVDLLIADLDRRLEDVAGAPIREELSATEIGLLHDDSREANLGDIATKAYRYAVPGTVAAIETLSLTGIRVKAGPLTLQDLHDVMPHIYDFENTRKEWTIKIWNARGSDIGLFINLINLTNTLALDRTGFFTHDGIEVVYEPKTDANPVAKVKEIRIGGEILDVTRRYPVAILDGTLMALKIASEKFYLGVDFSQLTETGIEGPQAVIEYGKTVPLFTEANLRAGARTFTTIADPAIYHYGIRVRKDADGEPLGIEVDVTNLGLARSQKVRVECFTGELNNALLHKSEEQVYELLGEQSVDAIETLGVKKVFLPWKRWSFTPTGILPVKCRLESAVDGYAANSEALVALKVASEKN